MKFFLNKQNIIIILIPIIILLGVGLKNYSDSLRKDGQRELLEIKNRKAAITKIRLAQTIWPFLKFDGPYQNFLGQLSVIEQRSAVDIVLKESASTEDINTLVSELQAITGVKQVKVISKEEALNIYKEANKSEPLLLKLVQPNIFPRSIEIYLDDFTLRNRVEQTAKNKPFVMQVVQML